MAKLEGFSEQLQKRDAAAAPVEAFHKAAAAASVDDVRIYWDVRIVRGKDRHFASSEGVSTLPGALSSKMKANGPAMIQQEVVDKIALPLMAAFQAEGERQNAGRMGRLADSSLHSNPDRGATGGDKIMDLVSQNNIEEDEEEDDDVKHVYVEEGGK